MPRLPSLNALRTFEAIARLGSMNDAAQELHVTQSAVSRQLRTLPGERRVDEPGGRRRALHALPAGSPGGGNQCRADGCARLGHLGGGGKPPPCPEGAAGDAAAGASPGLTGAIPLK